MQAALVEARKAMAHDEVPIGAVVAVDGCRASLECAETFRARASAANLQLVRADLFDLPFPEGAFTFVVSRGVVHHTPDPYAAIARVARCVAPGGVLLLGFYEMNLNGRRIAGQGRSP